MAYIYAKNKKILKSSTRNKNCPVIITFRKEVTKIPDFPWIAAAAAVSMVPIKIFALNPNKNKSYGPPSPQSELQLDKF